MTATTGGGLYADLLQRGAINPLGFYDLGRQPRPVATAYKEIAEPRLPYGSVLGFSPGLGR